MYLDHLQLSLRSANLSTLAELQFDNIQHYLQTLSMAFGEAFADNDCPSMLLCIDFFNSIKASLNRKSAKSEDERKTCLTVFQQLLNNAEQTEAPHGSEAIQILYSMARQVASFHGESMAILDLTMKSVCSYFEASQDTPWSEAVLLMTEIVQAQENQLNSTMDDTVKQTLKLQMDSVIGAMTSYVLSSSDDRMKSDQHVADLMAILRCVLQLHQIQDWRDIVLSGFAQPSQIVIKIKNLEVVGCKAPLSLLLFKMASAFRDANAKWEKVYREDFFEDDSAITEWAKCLSQKCHINHVGDILRASQSTPVLAEKFHQALAGDDKSESHRKPIPRESIAAQEQNGHIHDVNKVLEKVAQSMEKMEVRLGSV